jgi:Reverse transcriptase (RNA-dependent DNA polymerase)
MIRINSILDGSYKEKHLESLLPNHLSEQQKRDLTSILDVCKKKTSTEQDNLIKTALSTEVTFEEWNNQLYAKKGRTTPGPTNVTYNMIKAAPPNINKALFLIYKRFYQLKVVPKEWQKRIMALIPKKAEVTINTLRPIMLLETGRKLWLGIIAARLDNTMTAMDLFHPAQTGCSHNRGTEDAIMTVLNGLEDAHQRRENLHLISFDTSKAFDSPARYSGLYIAWRRLGLDHEHAQYIINCDIENEITPKTTFSILHPNQAEPFRAECGTPQGDSLAGYQWRAITDIAITFLSEHKSEWDAYTYRHQTSTHLREIEPVIFVDDMNALSKSTQGCARLVQLQATLAQLLNFNLNPQKTWRMSIVWDEEKKLLLDQTHTSLEYINPHNNRAGQIRTVRNNEICRILGAYITADLNPNHLQQKLRLEMQQLVKYIEKKKMHAAVFNAVLHQSIYPKMAYQAKFSSLQHKEINAAFQPVKDLLEKINNIQLFPKEIIYGGSAETYAMPFKQLSDYVNSAKHGIINRLMDGHTHYKEAILAMIQRGIQQKNRGLPPLPPNGQPASEHKTPLKRKM